MKYLAILPANKLNAESLWQEYLHMQQKTSLSEKSTIQRLLLELLETAVLTVDVIFFTPILLGEKHLGHSLLLAFLSQVAENPKKKALHYAMHYIRTIIVNNLGEKAICHQSDRLMYTLLSKHEGEHEAIRKAVERMRKKPATPEAFDDFLTKVTAVPTAQDKSYLPEVLQAVYCTGLLTHVLIDSYMQFSNVDAGAAAQALFSSAMNRRKELCEKVLGLPCPAPLTIA